MALTPYLVTFTKKGAACTKVVHGQKELNEHKKAQNAELVSTLKKGKWTPALTHLQEDFATWEK